MRLARVFAAVGCWLLMWPLLLFVRAGAQAVMVNVCVGETNGDGGGGGGGGITVNNGSDDSRSSFSVVTCSAITYVMAQRLAQRFVAPSPQYLTAVYRTLTSSFPEFSDRAIEIRDYTGERKRGKRVRSTICDSVVPLSQPPRWDGICPVSLHNRKGGKERRRTRRKNS